MRYLFFAIFALSLASCVSKKDYNLMEQSRNEYMRQLEGQKVKLQECVDSKAALERQIERLQVSGESSNEKVIEYEKRLVELNKEIENLNQRNESLVDQMENLSLISRQGAENIKKSLETLSSQSDYIRVLNDKIQNRDSLNLLLSTTIKRSLANVNDSDINVDVEGGVVFISISDKMLFDSGQYILKARAREVLGKIASIANDHTQLDLLVEGHTDDDPIKSGSFMRDNWDLSALRATSVVRSLQQDHGVDPSRMTAGARSQYVPKASNATAEGKSQNRRTKIYLLPKIDQYYQLIEESVVSESENSN